MHLQKIRGLEFLFFVLFAVIWLGMILGQVDIAGKLSHTLKKVPFLQDGFFRIKGECLFQQAQSELVPSIAFGSDLQSDNILVPMIHGMVQTELFPIQKYSIDYWNQNDRYQSLYSDVVPEYFTESEDASIENKKTDPGRMEQTGAGQSYSIQILSDPSFLLDHFYTVDSTTSLTKADFEEGNLVRMDLSANCNTDGKPLVLIYHTHGSEDYKKEKGKSESVIEVGEVLEKQLQERYGISVLHDESVYDQVDGVLDRNAAYNYAGDSVERTLKKNPSIQVVLDLHRDSVEDSIHLVTEMDGKETAQIMFFNGVSRLEGEGDIEYLYNPNQSANLAFSLQMQLLAAKYYPDFTRKIYIKGYRYNLHLAKRSMLIEVGAQNNTAKEAKNAMKPLAELLYRLLMGEKAYQKEKQT